MIVRRFNLTRMFLAATAAQDAHLSLHSFVWSFGFIKDWFSMTLQVANFATFANLQLCNIVGLLDRPAGHTRWTYHVDIPGGRTRWTDHVDVPGGRTMWTDQLCKTLLYLLLLLLSVSLQEKNIIHCCHQTAATCQAELRTWTNLPFILTTCRSYLTNNKMMVVQY